MPYVNLPPRLCARCGIAFKPARWPQQVYCSRACANTIRNEASRKEPQTRSCLQCGTTFEVPSYSKKQYCSRSCVTRARWARFERQPKKPCPAHMPERRRAYYAANRERIRAQRKERYSAPEQRVKHAENMRRRRQADPEVARRDERQRVARSYVNVLKAQVGACQRCGYHRYLGALEWHHRDPSQKSPGDMRKKSREVIEKELAGCVLLCANCHKELHGRLWLIEEVRSEQSATGDIGSPSGADRLAAPLSE